jgi:subtilisin family serine protease
MRAGAIGQRMPASEAESFDTGSIAVRFVGNAISQEASTALEKLGAHQLTDINPQGAATFSIPQSSDPRVTAQILHGVHGIIASGPVVYRYPLGVIPNDPIFMTDNIHQWDLYMTQMPNAWSVTTGLTSVRIAVIDTGYDTTNPDLMGKVDNSIVFDLCNGQRDGTASIEDKDGHGTDVSGIAAADTNNMTDVAGVGFNVHLLEARVFPYGNNPGASTMDIAAAINWAVAAGAKVINLSLGSSTPDPVAEEPAVASAIAAGVIVVAATGNQSSNTIDYPAADPGVIAVGASAYHDLSNNTIAGGHEYVAAYSNYGPGLTLVAPGGDPNNAQKNCTMQSCIDFLQWIENLDSLQGPFTEAVGLFAGTSMAAPHVAGAAGLMVSKDAALTPAKALSIFKSAANNDNISDPHQGAGRLNVLKALNATP